MDRKTLSSGNNETVWGSKILKDLKFIKKNLRYPFSKVTIIPLLIIVPILLLGVSTLLTDTHAAHNPRPFSKTISFCILLIMPLATVIRYWQILRFKTIRTSFFAAQNMKLVQRFLSSQHLAFYRHPDAPEVFQIISKALPDYKNEQREVMVFIADDKRILINSHFTEQTFGFLPATKNSRKMAAHLQAWLKTQPSNETSVTIL